MRKIILFCILLIFISFVSASNVPLDSVINSEDLAQINANINFIKDNYEAEIKFVIEDSENPVTMEALYSFVYNMLDKNNAKGWNTLIFYNKNMNKLKFVIYKQCDFVYDYMKQLKEENFIKNILNEQNPSDSEISNMFLQISIDFKNTAQSLDENTCPEIKPIIFFREKEYEVPPDILKSMYVVTQKATWELANPAGLYVSENFLPSNPFDFLPFVDSPKEEFYKLVREKTVLSDNRIDEFYNILTTKGNIVLVMDVSDRTLFHERVHKTITEKLTTQEIQTLKDARSRFLDYLGTTEYFYGLIASYTSMSIKTGHWQELYTYMAAYEKYPNTQNYRAYIDGEVYELFSSRYPEAYRIYQKVYNLASD